MDGEILWEDVLECVRNMPDELRAALRKMWIVVWCVVVFCTLVFWGFFVNEMRVNRSIIGRIVLIGFLFGFIGLEYVSFVKTLKTACQHTFPFDVAVISSVCLFWGTVIIFIIGVVTCVKQSFVNGRFRPPRLVRLFQPYHYCIPITQMAFAIAHSSPIGIGLAFLRILIVAYQNLVFRLRKPVRRYGKWP